MTSRPYQSEIHRATAAGWQEFDRQLVVSATGTGKTHCFCGMARTEHEQGGRTLILVDQRELNAQAVAKIQALTGLPCGVDMADSHADPSVPIVVATVQTLIRRLDNWPRDHFSLVVADEADKSLAPSWQAVLKHFDEHAKVCGFTATPNRSDQRSLGEYYQNVAFEATLFDFIGNGKWAFDILPTGERVQRNWLAPIVVKMLPIKIDLSGVHTREGDFDVNELDDAITPHLTEAALAIREHASFRRVLVFVPLIATSQKFVEICRSVGLSAEHIDGTSEDRADKLARFERGDFDVLVNSALLLRGVDIPPIDCVVMLRPTKSISLYQQAIGRGTRLAEFKENLLLLDFLYDAQKKLICRPAHLVAKTAEEAEAITDICKGQAMPAQVGEQLTAFDLLGMQSLAQAQRERALRKKLEEHQDKKSKYVSAEEFALKAHRTDLAEYEPVMAWESQPPSDAQAKYLKRAGIDLETVRGKGHASKLLDVVFASQKLTLASPKTQELMRRLPNVAASVGVTDPAQATAAQGRQFFARLNNKKKERAI